MFSRLLLSCVACLLAFSVLSNEAGTSSISLSQQYLLGAGDVIDIGVYDEPDLSIQVRIDLSGSISYPLLGDVRIAGLTPKEVENKLLAGLKGPYLVDPSVTVSISEYRPFYVTGEVSKPGSYAFHPGLTVDKAISIAGGFTDRASRRRIFVIHDGSAVRSGDVVSNEKTQVRLSDVVRPGDVITIEQSIF